MPTENTDAASTNPWGADFDAEKAWKLVTDLRADKAQLQTARDEAIAERDAVTTERDEAVTRATTAEAQVAEHVERETKSTRDALIAKILADHELPDDLADFLTATDEEALVAQASRLSGGRTPKAAEDTEPKPEGEQEQVTPGRPEPTLTPGHGGEQTLAFDADAIATAARAAR